MRDEEGAVGAFYNTCRHRGTLLCPYRQGKQRHHVCRYHGWSYDSAGRNVHITNEALGQYTDSFAQSDHGLVRLPRFASYRGLLFASLRDDVPSLEEHLGDARVFIDLVVDQSPTAQLEYVPGDVRYTFKGNWKLQFENGLDIYHFLSTHSSYVDLMAKRGQRLLAEAPPPFVPQAGPDQSEVQGSFNFAYGHAVNWTINSAPRVGARPLSIDPVFLEAVRARVGEDRAHWMMRQRNLTIFPNLQIIDISSLQFRTWRPLSAGVTEMTSHCVGVVGESPAARRLRIRNYEDFFNPSGLASSDDNVMYEYCQAGYAAAAGPTQGYERGLGGPPHNAAVFADELGIAPADSSLGPLTFGGETNFHPGYREWKRLLERGGY